MTLTVFSRWIAYKEDEKFDRLEALIKERTG